jgi:Glycosyl transferase 4-like domain
MSELESGDALLQAGRLREAHAAYARAGATGAVRSVAAQLALLEGTWRPPPLRVEARSPRPGRIAHLVGGSLPDLQTGYTLRTRHVTAAQRAAGLDPHVLTPYGFPWDRPAPPHEDVDGIPHWRLEPGAISPYDEALAATVTGLAARLAELRPAALHAASDFVNARVALALRDALGAPVVYEVRGLWEESWVAEGGPRPPGSELRDLRRQAELRCMREADAVVTLGEGMRAEIVAAGIPGERVVVVPNAADAPPPPGRAFADDGEPVVGYVGAVVP